MLRPPLDADQAHALAIWNLMEGWHPERLPVLAAVYELGDVEGLLTRLVAIRDAVNESNKKRHAI